MGQQPSFLYTSKIDVVCRQKCDCSPQPPQTCDILLVTNPNPKQSFKSLQIQKHVPQKPMVNMVQHSLSKLPTHPSQLCPSKPPPPSHTLLLRALGNISNHNIKMSVVSHLSSRSLIRESQRGFCPKKRVLSH